MKEVVLRGQPAPTCYIDEVRKDSCRVFFFESAKEFAKWLSEEAV